MEIKIIHIIVFSTKNTVQKTFITLNVIDLASTYFSGHDIDRTHGSTLVDMVICYSVKATAYTISFYIAY